MKKLPMKNLLTALLFVAAIPAYAYDDAEGTPINEKRPLQADGRVSVSNVSGLIEVKAWNRDEVEITGTLGAGSERLEITGDAGSLRIAVILPRKSHDVEASELFLRVPEGARVELEGVSADLKLHGTRGEARLSTVSGSVQVLGAMRTLRAQSVSGDVMVKAPAADTRLESVSGDVQAEQLTGEVQIETVSGNASVSGGKFTRVEAQSVSGDLTLRADSLADAADLRAESVSGQIHMTLPKALNASVEADSYSGEVRTDYGAINRNRPEHFEATLGNGKGRIRAESHSGNISLQSR